MTKKHWWLVIILVAGAVSEIFIYNVYFRKQPTGWNYNDPDNGGFDTVPYYNDGQDGGLILIEGGAFTHIQDSSGNSFYILERDTFIMGKIDTAASR